jgi:hypothetical protein
VATKGDIDTEAFLRVLGPFFRAAQGTLDPAFQDRVCRKVFSKFITDFARENMVRDDALIDENRRFGEVESEALQGLIFNIASDDDTIEKNRRKLYLLHQEFPALTGKQFVDTDAMEEEEEEEVVEVKVKVTNKEKKLKQINTEVADMKIVEKENGTKSVKVTEEIEKKTKKADKVESKIEHKKIEKKVEKKEEKVEKKEEKVEKKEEKVEKKEEKVEKKEEKKESKKEKRVRAEFEEDDLSTGNDLTAMILKKKQKAANGTEDLSASVDKLKMKMKQKERADESDSQAAPAPVVAVTKAVSPSPSLPLAPFIASKKFTGAKTNYVFKNVSTACCFEYVSSFHGLDVQLKASVYCSSSQLYKTKCNVSAQ